MSVMGHRQRPIDPAVLNRAQGEAWAPVTCLLPLKTTHKCASVWALENCGWPWSLFARIIMSFFNSVNLGRPVHGFVIIYMQFTDLHIAYVLS